MYIWYKDTIRNKWPERTATPGSAAHTSRCVGNFVLTQIIHTVYEKLPQYYRNVKQHVCREFVSVPLLLRVCFGTERSISSAICCSRRGVSLLHILRAKRSSGALLYPIGEKYPPRWWSPSAEGFPTSIRRSSPDESVEEDQVCLLFLIIVFVYANLATCLSHRLITFFWNITGDAEEAVIHRRRRQIGQSRIV